MIERKQPRRPLGERRARLAGEARATEEKPAEKPKRGPGRPRKRPADDE